MRVKRPLSGVDLLKSRLKKGFGVFIALEVGFAAAGYWAFRKINRDQEFRYYLHGNWPTVLSTYYGFCNQLGEEYRQIEGRDLEVWRRR